MSALQGKSANYFRRRGYLTGSLEKQKQFPADGKSPCPACGHLPVVSYSEDLWNVFDLVAIKQGTTVFVQVTDRTNHSHRRNKILASGAAKLCVLAGCFVCVQSWRKKDNRWESEEEWIAIDQFTPGLPAAAQEYYEQQHKQRLRDFPRGSTLFREAI